MSRKKIFIGTTAELLEKEGLVLVVCTSSAPTYGKVEPVGHTCTDERSYEEMINDGDFMPGFGYIKERLYL